MQIMVHRHARTGKCELAPHHHRPSAQALVYGMRVIPTHPSAGLHSLQSIFKNYKNSLLIHSMYMGQMEKLRLREFTHLRDTY